MGPLIIIAVLILTGIFWRQILAGAAFFLAIGTIIAIIVIPIAYWNHYQETQEKERQEEIEKAKIEQQAKELTHPVLPKLHWGMTKEEVKAAYPDFEEWDTKSFNAWNNTWGVEHNIGLRHHTIVGCGFELRIEFLDDVLGGIILHHHLIGGDGCLARVKQGLLSKYGQNFETKIEKNDKTMKWEDPDLTIYFSDYTSTSDVFDGVFEMMQEITDAEKDSSGEANGEISIYYSHTGAFLKWFEKATKTPIKSTQ